MISKYWVVLAFLGAVGCSGAGVDDTGSSQDKVDDKGVDKGNGDTAAPSGTKDGNDPKGGTTAPVSGNDCSSQLDAIAEQIAALTDKYGSLKESCAGGGTTTDPGTKPDEPPTTGKPDPGTKPEDPPTTKPDPGGVPDKGDPTTGPVKGDPGTLPPSSDPCGPALDAVNAYLAEATKSGDTAQIIAAKEKYTAVLQSCAPATTSDAPPPKK